MPEAFPQHRIPFYEDQIVAVQQDDARVFVVFSLLCSNLKLERTSQMRRVQRHEVLREGFIVLPIQTDGGPQQMQCLQLEMLPLWLAGIHASRIHDADLREKVVRYQREAAFVLWEAFKPQILRAEVTLAPADVDPAIQELQRIAEMGRAMMQLAEQQIELQRQQHVLAQRLDKAGRVVRGMQIDIADIQVRLGSVEGKLHPHAYITDEQAAHVSQLVKALANLLTEQGGKNQYQGIFAELYRRFGVSGYKLIRIEQYDAVLAFLEQWREAAMRGAE